MNAVYDYINTKLGTKATKEDFINILQQLSDADIMWLITKKIEGRL